jgi:acyl-CoA thioesterase FadM
VNYLDQTRADDRVHVDLFVVAHDDKRLHVFTSMHRHNDDGSPALVATAEHLLLHVDTAQARATPADERVMAQLASVARAHARVPRPEQVGRHVGQRR